MRLGDYVTDYRGAEALFRTPTQRTWFSLFLVSLLLLPFIAGQYLTFLACLVAIHVIAATGLNITTGFTGLISIGHAVFLGVGAYTVAVLAGLGTPFWLSLPAGAGLAAGVGLAVGLPSLRIKGLYLAVATLAAQFLLSFVFREWESVTGGVRGLSVPPAILAGWAFDSDAKIYFLIMPLAVLVVLGARNLFRTRIGRAFIAIRDRDLSAEVIGINLFRYKLLSFAIGAAYAGLAGGLWAYFYRAITPESFTLQLGIFYLAAIIVGGLGSILGSVLGALFMALVPELLRALVGLAALYSTHAAILLSPLREIVFGVLIIAFLIFEPHGLAEIWRRVRRYFFLWPFRT
jgi:branched-chain amino acid transport system permease protein